MHVLLIHQAFAALDEPGGTRHHELARHLAGKGHRVTVITSPVSYLTGADQGQPPRWVEKILGEQGETGEVVILRTYAYPALHRSFIHRMVNFFSFMASSFLAGLRVKGVDLVWGTSPPIFQGVTAWMLAVIKRVPFLFEVRDLWPAFAVQVGVLRSRVLIRLSEWLERFLYKKADRVMVNSPGFIEHVRARGARHVDLVPNGSDTALFKHQANGEAFRRQHGLEDKFVVLYAGAHGMSNDLGVVLAAADLVRDLPEVVFIFLGDGKEKPALIKRAADMKLENVRFLAPVPKNQMPETLAAANACLAILKPIPLYATVYPNKVFDYMAAGRPVLLAIDGAIRQVVEQAGAGIFVPPGDSCTLSQAAGYLIEHPGEARQMGLRGRTCVAKNFDRKMLAEKLIFIIEQMLAKGHDNCNAAG